jgi:hypothetical protein
MLPSLWRDCSQVNRNTGCKALFLDAQVTEKSDTMNELPRKTRKKQEKLEKILREIRQQVKPDYLTIQVPGGGSLASYIDHSEKLLSQIELLDERGLINLEILVRLVERIVILMDQRDDLISLMNKTMSTSDGGNKDAKIQEFKKIVDNHQKMIEGELGKLRTTSVGL